jgi:curved DNA-binding protein CbpA
MTYYEVLEIDRSASTAEIERAFRRMARRVHPDLNSGDRAKAEAHMKVLNEIRDTLTDPLLRAGYDERLRLEALRNVGAGVGVGVGGTAPASPRAATPRPQPEPGVAAPAPPVARAPTYVAPEYTEPRSSHSLWVGLFLAALGAGVLVVALVSSPRFRDPVPEPAAGAPDAGSALDAAPLLTAPVAPRAARADDDTAPAARLVRRTNGRGVVVHIGSTADEVLRALGQPDRYEPGPHPGESVLHYGALRLEMKNGRVVGGDAAAR